MATVAKASREEQKNAHDLGWHSCGAGSPIRCSPRHRTVTTAHSRAMSPKSRTIEVDAETAKALEARAAERGTSISQVVAELIRIQAGNQDDEADQINELDRRWAAVQAGEATVADDEVVRWLETWGTPAFRAWHER